MSRPGYVTARRVVELHDLLGPAEWALLRSVATARLLTTTQLQRLHDAQDLAGVRRIRRQLARLTELQVLARLDERSVGGRGAGSASYIYGVGLAGQRLLAADGRTRRPWTPRPSWLAHALEVSELYVRLIESERQGQLKLLTFRSEPGCWRRFNAGYGDVTLKPDAYLRLHVGRYEHRYFVEVDMGTESPTTLAAKLHVYGRYWQSGQEQARHGIFPLVLWLVPTEQRRRVVVDVTGRQPLDAQAIHASATFDRAVDFICLEPP